MALFSQNLFVECGTKNSDCDYLELVDLEYLLFFFLKKKKNIYIKPLPEGVGGLYCTRHWYCVELASYIRTYVGELGVWKLVGVLFRSSLTLQCSTKWVPGSHYL